MFEGFFGEKHLIALAACVGFLLIFFVSLRLFDKKLQPARGKTYVLRVIALSMIILEFIKMVYTLSSAPDASGPDQVIPYNLFPFQLCSMPLLLFPLFSFGGERTRRIIGPPAFIIGCLAGVITLVYPANVIGDISMPWTQWQFYPLYSFLYHTLMIAFAGYMVQSKLYRLKAFDFVWAFGGLFLLAMVAIVLNSVIENADFFMLGRGEGSPFQFIIDATNQFVYILFMAGLAALLIFLVYSYWIIKALVVFIKKRKAARTEV